MLTKLAYYIILLPISYLPHFVLYRIADVVYFFLTYVFRYRRAIITKNLKNSFPKLSDKAITGIRNDYYLHLSDLIVEIVKNFTISQKELDRCFTFENPELLNKLHAQGKSVIIMGGHYGNWERYAIASGSIGKHEQLAIYKPFTDRFFDKKMKIAREKYGMKMISMLMTKKYFLQNPQDPKCITFAMDQWTPNPQIAYWTKFLNQETSFFKAGEILAREFDWAVVYCSLEKVKRHRYHATYELISDDVRSQKDGAIIEAFVRKLEKTIEGNPANWLWSHRRWKRTKAEVFANVAPREIVKAKKYKRV